MKKIMLWTIVFLVLASCASAFAPRHEYVKLVENTNECLTDCHTIYEIHAVDRPLTLNPQNLFFKYEYEASCEPEAACVPYVEVEGAFLGVCAVHAVLLWYDFEGDVVDEGLAGE